MFPRCFISFDQEALKCLFIAAGVLGGIGILFDIYNEEIYTYIKTKLETLMFLGKPIQTAY